MKKKLAIITVILIISIISVSAYGTYTLYSSTGPSSTPTPTTNPARTEKPSNSPTATPTMSPITTTKPQTTPASPQNNAPATSPSPSPTPPPTSVTVTDGAGQTVTIPLPVTRIVSLNAGLTEILCLMGSENLMVARTTDAITPPSILNVPAVGENAYVPNIEAILDLNPDLIVSDSALTFNPVAYQQLTDADIPIFIADSTAPQPANPSKMTPEELYNSPTVIDYTCELMQNFTAFVGHQDEANEYINWAQNYNKVVKDRIAALTPGQQVKVFLDWYSYPYYTFVNIGVYQAGGVNIAENQTVYAPQLSPEFVVEQNPDVIIELILSPSHNINDFIAAKNNIMSKPELQGVEAVKNGRVYISDFNARGGVRAVVGYLYWAKWLQPSLFSDIDPATVNQQLNQKFFGTAMAGTFAYP